MEYLVSKRADLVDAINELKKGTEPSYVLKHKNNNIWFKFDKELFESNSTLFYEKIYSGEPQPNPYYVEQTDLVEDLESDNTDINGDEICTEEALEDSLEHNEETVADNEEPQQPLEVQDTCQEEQEVCQDEVIEFVEATTDSNFSQCDEYVKGLQITIDNLQAESAEKSSMYESLCQELERVKCEYECVLTTHNNTATQYKELELAHEQSAKELSELQNNTKLNDIKLEDLVVEIVKRGFNVELKSK